MRVIKKRIRWTGHEAETNEMKNTSKFQSERLTPHRGSHRSWREENDKFDLKSRACADAGWF
jgi:hypothetical protein